MAELGGGEEGGGHLSMGPFDSRHFLNCLLFLPLKGCSFVLLVFPFLFIQLFIFAFGLLFLECVGFLLFALVVVVVVCLFLFSFSVHVTCRLIFVEGRGERMKFRQLDCLSQKNMK